MYYNKTQSALLVGDSLTTDSTYISPISIKYLRGLEIENANINIEDELSDGTNYKRYIVSYYSEGYKTFGLLTIPFEKPAEGGYRAVIFNHGYIPPKQYQTTQGYNAYVDYLARNNFVVFKIDYRGNGKSEGEPSGTYFSSAYTIDSLSALKALQNYEGINPERIGMWGHSMAGNLVLRAMLISEDIKAGVIWSGAVYSYADFVKYKINDSSYIHKPSDASPDDVKQKKETSSEIQKLRSSHDAIDFDDPFWRSISLTQNINYLKYPLQLHHAADDTVINIGYSKDLSDVLKQNNKIYEYYEYAGGGHNITSPYFEDAMQKTVDFFDKYL